LPHIPQFAASFVVLISQPVAAFLSQSANPRLQAEAHVPVAAVHDAVEFAGMGHTVHAVPHAVASLSATHLPAQR
jgi:hypothetical protein